MVSLVTHFVDWWIESSVLWQKVYRFTYWSKVRLIFKVSVKRNELCSSRSSTRMIQGRLKIKQSFSVFLSYLNLIFIYIKHVHDCWTFGIHPTMPKVHSALKHSPCTVPITCLQCSFYMLLSVQQLCLLTWHIVCFKAIWAVHTIPAVSSSDVKSVWRRVCTLYTLRFFCQKGKRYVKVWQTIDHSIY